VRPHLYSHGSAIVGTVQQVAGAAGTALFITIMSTQSAQLVAGGSAAGPAVASGVRAAFLAGAIISVLSVVAAIFIRKPVDHPDDVRARGEDTAEVGEEVGEPAS
jgi:DHA2 family lincomycin resistance protein-like MFS transporter